MASRTRQGATSGKSGRLGAVKKRTGCKTCKKRKVLCSEERPCCLRCVRAKLACGGYDNFINLDTNGLSAGQTQVTNSQQLVSRNRPSSSPFVCFRGFGTLSGLKSEDCQAFDYCRLETLTSLHRLDWSDLWVTTIPAAAHIEPAVLHAMLALGAAHQVLDGCLKAGDNPGQVNLLRAYRHSGRAMRHLQRLLQDHDPNSGNCDTILIVCYMLLTFETMSGRNDVALLHLQHARRIIRMLQATRQPDSDPSLLCLSARSDTIEQDLVQGFTRMDIQAMNWGGPHSDFQLVDDPTSPDPTNIPIPYSFTSISDARRYLLFLLNESTKLITSPVVHPTSALQQTRLLCRLSQWEKSHQSSPFYHKLSTTPSPNTNTNNHTRSLLLQMHHALLTLTICTHTFSTPEAQPQPQTQTQTQKWDPHLSLFQHITHLTHALLPHLPAIGIDMAIIQPALLTAVHCRHPHVRRHALSALHKLRERKLWDTTLDIGRAEVVMRVEEEGAGVVYGGSEMGEGRGDGTSWMEMDLGRLVPEEMRCWDVTASWADGERRELVVVVTRSVSEGRVDEGQGGGDRGGDGDGDGDGLGARQQKQQSTQDSGGEREVRSTGPTRFEKHVHRVTVGVPGSPRPGNGGHEGFSVVEGLFLRTGQGTGGGGAL